ncbi:BLUF domain-containing protein [Pedococcus sp. KACC 23699]|uniref:BLUF domain-containing protein n=1 Tax=Pedococcus sp. KACC 23699 TaxID=3149228 RepID=A0AAU7JSR0_9MICO
MLSLTYFSTASSDLSKEDLLELLERTRSKNTALGLTGVLLYSDGNFVQTLEGPEDVVEDAYARISRDRRHHGLFVALREEIEQRAYPEWSMGFREITREESGSVPGFTDYLSATPGPRQSGQNRAEVFHRAFRTLMP